MKKQYINPEMEMVRLEQTVILCVSGQLIDDEATEPASAPLFGTDDDF